MSQVTGRIHHDRLLIKFGSATFRLILVSNPPQDASGGRRCGNVGRGAVVCGGSGGPPRFGGRFAESTSQSAEWTFQEDGPRGHGGSDASHDTLFDFLWWIRQAISTTNAIESVNSVSRPVVFSSKQLTRNRKIYRNEDSALKITYLVIREASKKWTMPIPKWKAALNHFAILFENRLPQPQSERRAFQPLTLNSVQGLAQIQHQRHAEAGVGTRVDLDVGPHRTHTLHDVPQVVIGSQERGRRPMPQADHHELTVLRAGDRQRIILVLIVVPMKQRELLRNRSRAGQQ